jgi:hypothetical protein
MFDKLSPALPPPENRAFCEIMCKNMVQPDRPHMTTWRMRFAYWIKARDTQSKYVIFIAFPRQQLLRERACILPYSYSLVNKIPRDIISRDCLIKPCYITSLPGQNLPYQHIKHSDVTYRNPIDRRPPHTHTHKHAHTHTHTHIYTYIYPTVKPLPQKKQIPLHYAFLIFSPSLAIVFTRVLWVILTW